MKHKLHALTISLFFIFNMSFAQLINHQVIVVSGGNFSNTNEKVRIGSYKPFSNNYYQFDSIDGNFTNVALVNEGKLFVNAKDILYKYDLDTYTRELQATIPGVSAIAVLGNKLVVARNYGTSNNYVQILDKTNLSFIASIPQVSDECHSVVIVGDTAYVSVPGNWMATTGKIAMINLATNTFITEIDLGTNGAGIKNLYVRGNFIYSINTTNKVITKLNAIDRTFTHNTLTTPNLATPSGVWGDTLYTSLEGSQWSSENIGTLSLTSFTAFNTNKITGNFSNSVLDTISSKLFCAKTDYSSYGDFLVYNLQGNRLDSVRVGVSPDALGIDYRTNHAVDFSLSTKNPYDTEVITLTPFSTGTVTSYNWTITPTVEFVEGTSANSASPKISANPGVYTVKLNVNFSVGSDVEQKNNVLNVRLAPGFKENFVDNIVLFPNPATDVLSIYDFIGNANFVDINGKVVKSVSVTENTKINISNLDNGIYFVHLSNSKTKNVLKFVKQ